MFSGVFPALLTPFTPDDRVDTLALGRLIAYVLERGVNGLYVTGSTGEGILLTEDERRLVVETAVKQVHGRVPVIVHVGAPATPMCERLARHAEQAGAQAVSSIPPFYYSVGAQGVEEHYRRIARATRLPLYVYNIPGLTNVNVAAEMMRKLFNEGMIKGLKYAATDLLGFREIIESCGGKLNVFSGPDEMFLPFLTMGSHGGIGSTYNALPNVFVRLFAAWKEGNIKKAQELQYFIDRYVLVILRHGGPVVGVKATMGLLGVGCGEPRAPLVTLTAEQKTRLRRDLEEIGFFDVTKE